MGEEWERSGRGVGEEWERGERVFDLGWKRDERGWYYLNFCDAAKRINRVMRPSPLLLALL